ncbi:hypothetical protein VM98_36185, partial [Streptomyces rubellomurinus subsp. indigoferus]
CAVASALPTPTAPPLARGPTPGAHLLRANALLGSASSAARLGGPALAGVLVYPAGPGCPALLQGLDLVLARFLLLRITVVRVHPERRSLRWDLAELWVAVRVRDWYWFSLVPH